MGFSTTKVDVAGALHGSRTWPVVSAGNDPGARRGFYKDRPDGEHYFRPGAWPVPASEIAFADKVEDADRIFFRLKNGCFVEVEKPEGI